MRDSLDTEPNREECESEERELEKKWSSIRAHASTFCADGWPAFSGGRSWIAGTCDCGDSNNSANNSEGQWKESVSVS